MPEAACSASIQSPAIFSCIGGEVFAYSFQGGGGYGDPIRRDPERVARDVRNGL